MSKKKTSHKKPSRQTPDTGAALAVKSSSVSFPPMPVEKSNKPATKPQAL